MPLLRVVEVRLGDDEAATDVERSGHGLDPALTDGPEEVVFDSTVAVVVAPSGKFRNAQTPPSVSAKAMIAPPWRTPAAVHFSGAQSMPPRTSSGSARLSSMPRVPARGAISARFSTAEETLRGGGAERRGILAAVDGLERVAVEIENPSAVEAGA